ncbi:hypothetical protein IFO70_34820 [Phormidium tenue FACHB-886]|nr:hypothetical protein [Phormidium tenue FACHB-886]
MLCSADLLKPIDPNRELTAAGLENLAIELFGGMLSYPSLSKSVLAHKLGSKGQLTTVMIVRFSLSCRCWGRRCWLIVPNLSSVACCCFWACRCCKNECMQPGLNSPSEVI